MPLKLRASTASALSHDDLDGNFAEKVPQDGHGFSVGDLIYLGSSGWVLAQADNPQTTADGIVALVEGVDIFWVVTQDGSVVEWTHGLGGDDGDLLWLSQTTPGAHTLAKPAGGVQQPVGKIRNSGATLFRLGFVSMGI
jgi:hypothetical protein